MHRTIRCCVASCNSSRMVADGLVENPAGPLGLNAVRTLAATLGWVECDDSTPGRPCFKCPEHAAVKH